MSPSFATASASNSTACFSVVAASEPGLMLRVLELFAKRGMVPGYCCSRVEDDEISIDLHVAGLDPATTAHIAACFRQIPSVKAVLTFERAARNGSALGLGAAAKRAEGGRIRRRG